METYPRRHPELMELREEFLAPAFVAAVRDGSAAALRSVLEPVHPDLYALRLFTDDWCARMLDEVERISTWSAERRLALTRPNSMNRYGLVLDELGYAGAFEALLRHWLAPFGALLFPEVGGASLDRQHSFVVQYDEHGDTELGFHVDQSDMTLNLCLGGGFVESELYFRGRRCPLHLGTTCSAADEFRFTHRPGVGLLHAGKHRHGALPLAAGDRTNLIVWCNSSAERAREEREGAACTAWCAASRAR